MVQTTVPRKASENDTDGPRALLTDREREIVSGAADDISDSYRYQTISRVRRRFDRLEADMRALDAHGKLGREVRTAVCETEESDE